MQILAGCPLHKKFQMWTLCQMCARCPQDSVATWCLCCMSCLGGYEASWGGLSVGNTQCAVLVEFEWSYNALLPEAPYIMPSPSKHPPVALL